MRLPIAVEDEQVAVLADLQRPVGVRAAEGVGCVDGGCGQSLLHGHPQVDTRKVHDDWLRKERGCIRVWKRAALVYSPWNSSTRWG